MGERTPGGSLVDRAQKGDRQVEIVWMKETNARGRRRNTSEPIGGGNGDRDEPVCAHHGGLAQRHGRFKSVDEFFGQRSASVEDVAGNRWTINPVVEELTKEEMHARLDKMMQEGQ